MSNWHNAIDNQRVLQIEHRSQQMLTRLDHIALIVRDLTTAAAHYGALLGREPNWRGAEGGVEQVWFQFDNVALDLLSPVGSGPMGDWFAAQLDQSGEAIYAIAFATKDLSRTRHVLERRGVRSAEPAVVASTRSGTLERHEWTVLSLDLADTHGARLLIVDESDSQSDWPPRPSAPAIEAPVVGLDHVVITTSQPERAAALYGARLGLDMKLDRTNPDWGARLLFFKCGDTIVELAHNLKSTAPDAPDHIWGLSWRCADLAATHARLTRAGFEVSAIRTGRKPGTNVFTVKDRRVIVPTLMLGRSA